MLKGGSWVIATLGEKVHNNFLMGVKFGTSWGSPEIFSKSQYYDDFFKNVLISNFLTNFTRYFPVKNEDHFNCRF